MAELLAIPGIARTSEWFRWELVQIGRRLNVNPDYLSAVMSIESGYKPDAVNPYSDATGLIQFMPQTAIRLGTTVEELKGMSAEDQLAYVEVFYKPFRGRLKSAGDAYMATFMPAYVGYPSTHVLFKQGTIGYSQNSGLDRDKDGNITVGDVTSLAESRYSAGLKAGTIPVSETEPPRPKVGC